MTIEGKRRILFSRLAFNKPILFNDGAHTCIFEAVDLIREKFNVDIVDDTHYQHPNPQHSKYHTCNLRLGVGRLIVEFGGYHEDSTSIFDFIQSVLDEIEEEERTDKRIKELGEIRASYNNAELEAILDVEADLNKIKFSLDELKFIKKVINNANAYATVLNFDKK